MQALESVFEERAAAAGAFVHRVKAIPEQITEKVRQICGDVDIVMSDFPFSPVDIGRALQAMPGITINPDEALLAKSTVGITDAFAAVAETGSILQSNVHGWSGPVSLLTQWHIVLVEASRLVARPRHVFERSEWQALLTNMVFISGPSATADMGKLVRGVHGPSRLDILFLEDV